MDFDQLYIKTLIRIPLAEPVGIHVGIILGGLLGINLGISLTKLRMGGESQYVTML